MQIPNEQWLAQEARTSLERLWPRLEPALAGVSGAGRFRQRLDAQFPTLFRLLYQIYGDRYDFFYHLEQILLSAIRMFAQRPDALKAHDEARERDPQWFQSQNMIGGVCYIDLFDGSIRNLHRRIPYFKELGLTYLHLMPPFAAPAANSDGGYAVSDYRTIRPDLGTMTELAELADALRAEGISLVLDFVFNHTSDEHTWARQALAGDAHYQGYYFMFPDREGPDAYSQTLREIFPDQAPGSFTYRPEVDRWVWTTFHTFQWDLNYSNPAVFDAMLQEMLFLANQGVEVLRLDAVAFIWKQLGTSCENLPQAHWIIQAYNALVRVVAPAMLFKSEAIVHPDQVASYISRGEAPLSYNPTLMALLWEALATRSVRLLQHSMALRFDIPEDCAWVNYVRVHDDIGWTFADEDAADLGISGYDHRQFLNQFYSGRFAGGFARGEPFGYNPVNRDMRISGTAASLAGLEDGLERGDRLYIDNAIKRLLLIHSVILSAGGIPLIYLGDEIATLNDYRYEDDPAKQHDSRWVHRAAFNWQRAEQRHDPQTIPGRLYGGLRHLIAQRRALPALAGHRTLFFHTGSASVLGYVRDQRLLVLANFSDYDQTVPVDLLRAYADLPQSAHDYVSGATVALDTDALTLTTYQVMWLALS